MTKGKTTTKIKDRGYKKIISELGKTDKSFVTVGIHEGAGTYEKSKVLISQVAFWNEYGTSRIPSRPFIRSTIDTKGRAIRAFTKSLWGDVLRLRKTTRVALGALGTRVTNEIQGRITSSSSWAKVNAESTRLAKRFRRAKGKAQPLIDSWTMFRSIGWQSSVNKIKSKVTKNPMDK